MKGGIKMDQQESRNEDPAPDAPKKNSIGKKLVFPLTALGMDIIAPAFLFVVSLLAMYIGGGGFLLICILLMILSPIAGIVFGIVSLTLGKKEIGKAGVTISVIAIALPVLAVLIMILLFKTGVAVISLM